ncbi:efflux RND transporter permease subunit, partial [Pseudomonas sp. FW300-N1A5]|uniref:efflux RND transporter permease subunit n=1 Tax=Pseudomonas sp. FW300-N1A5 TaxID=2070664 RepID=UPI0011AF060F
VFVLLKPESQWRKGMTKDQIAKQISALIDEKVPEIGGAISQPIEMRTNELVSGVRSDVAAILYGPDIPTLREYGEKLGDALRGVPGAADVRVEAIE